jgi:hypothetical protein
MIAGKFFDFPDLGIVHLDMRAGRIAITTNGNATAVCDITDQKLLWEMSPHLSDWLGQPTALGESRVYKIAERKVKGWDLSKEDTPQVYQLDQAVKAVSLSPDGTMLVLTGYYQAELVHLATDRHQMFSYGAPRILWTPDSSAFALCGPPGTDSTKMEVISNLDDCLGQQVVFVGQLVGWYVACDRNQLVVVDQVGGLVRRLELDGSIVREIPFHTYADSVFAVAGAVLVHGNPYGVAEFLDLGDTSGVGRRVDQQSNRGKITSISADGETVAIGDRTGYVALISVPKIEVR